MIKNVIHGPYCQKHRIPLKSNKGELYCLECLKEPLSPEVLIGYEKDMKNLREGNTNLKKGNNLRKIIIMKRQSISNTMHVIKRISTHLTNQELDRSCATRTKNTGVETTWAVLPTKFQ